MAYPVAALRLKVLGVNVRTFRTAKGALLWYRRELDRRLGQAQEYKSGRTLATEEHKQQRQLTYAAIVKCLGPHHPADLTDDGLTISNGGRWRKIPKWRPGEALLWLCAWLENNVDDGTYMAEDSGIDVSLDMVRKRRNSATGILSKQAGLARDIFHRRCRKVEEVLRVRFVDAGLIEER